MAEPARLAAWLIDVHLGDTILSFRTGPRTVVESCRCSAVPIAAVIMYRRGQRPVVDDLPGDIRSGPRGGGIAAVSLRGAQPADAISRAGDLRRPPAWGSPRCSARVPRDPLRGRLTAGIMLLMVLFGSGICARDWMHPYHYALDEESPSFARQFWSEDPESITICSQTDLGREFWRNGCDSYYRCNQRIYSPSHHAGQKVPRRSDRRPPYGRFDWLSFIHQTRYLDGRALADRLEQTFRNYESAGREIYRDAPQRRPIRQVRQLRSLAVRPAQESRASQQVQAQRPVHRPATEFGPRWSAKTRHVPMGIANCGFGDPARIRFLTCL